VTIIIFSSDLSEIYRECSLRYKKKIVFWIFFLKSKIKKFFFRVQIYPLGRVGLYPRVQKYPLGKGHLDPGNIFLIWNLVRTKIKVQMSLYILRNISVQFHSKIGWKKSCHAIVIYLQVGMVPVLWKKNGSSEQKQIFIRKKTIYFSRKMIKKIKK